MTQTVTDPVTGLRKSYTDGGAAMVNITATDIEINHSDVNEFLIPVAAFYVHGKTELGIQMVIEDNALDQFQLRYKYSENGDMITRASVAADWTTPVNPILRASGSFVMAAVGAAHWMHLDVSGVYAVYLWAASGNAAGSKLKCRGAIS